MVAGAAQAAPVAPGSRGDGLLAWLRGQVIGSQEVVDGPFGPRRLLYADYTASGRAVRAIEDFIREHVLPRYANTHTEASLTGRQTGLLREQARRAVRAAVGGDADTLVIFAGTGATGAIDKLLGILGVRLPAQLEDRYLLSERIPPRERPVVFLGPFEHHSNELPWRESVADVVVVPADADGHIDQQVLGEELARHRDRPLKVGSFSAASNVTGITSDVPGITRLLHRHGALACWDYAAAAPYLPIRMGRREDGPDYLDAVFFSPHKFPGGPGSPGVLAVRRELVANRVPVVPGGGTVEYVSPEEQIYLADPEQREEGGTPDIIGAIRAGLALRLKQTVGAATIAAEEERLWRRARQVWSANPNIRILGDTGAARVPIVSFLVGHEDGYLHHNFVVALLSDLFGIQARGGCSCAGPYGHQLLGIDPEQARAHERTALGGVHGMKPGWARLSFNYFFDDETADYLIESVDLVASLGWRALTSYRFDPVSGLWRHRAHSDAGLVTLSDLRFGPAAPATAARARTAPDLAAALALGRDVLANHPLPHWSAAPSGLPPALEALRWFPLPAACLAPGFEGRP